MPRWANVAERFEASYMPEPMSGCWLWTGRLVTCSYGIPYGGITHGKETKAHRVSYLLHKGSIPDGMSVCHRCDNPACVNPDHLFLATHRDNMADRDRKGRVARTFGESAGNSKLRPDQAEAIRNSPLTSASQVGAQYGVTGANVRAIWKGETWFETLGYPRGTRREQPAKLTSAA